MISIFNGRKRSLGSVQGEVFAQLSVEFRQHLHLFKGARLHVFLCVALHADAKGWAYPSIEACIRRETGYNRETIINALNELCQLTIDGHRVLLAYQPINPDGTFQPNQYLIFPTPREVAEYETNNSRRRQPRDPKSSIPSAENPHSVEPSLEKPNSAKPNSENPHSKKNQPKAEPSEQEPNEPDDDDDAPWARQLIHEVLSSRGIDDPVPAELAQKLSSRLDGVELMMYAVQRVEKNASARLIAQYGPIQVGDVAAAAQRQGEVEANANGLLIHRLRKKAPDSQSRMLRTIQAARSAGIDAWLIGAGADPVTVSLWREAQDGILLETGLDLLDPQPQPLRAKTSDDQISAPLPLVSASQPPTPSASNHGTENGIQEASDLPTSAPTGKHLTAWNYARNALERAQSKGSVVSWLKSSQLIAAQDAHFVIGVPNSYVQEWFDQRLKPDLRAGFAERLKVPSDDVNVTFVVKPMA